MTLAIPKSDYTDAIERELPEWPGVTWCYEKRGRHYAVVVTYRGYTQFCIFPATGSDVRGPLNQISDLRNLLRRMGATRTENEKPAQQTARAPYKAPPPPPEPVAPIITDPRTGGFGPLRDLRKRLVSDALEKWAEIRVNRDRLEDAAHALIGAWHPEIIARAAELIREGETQ